MYRNLPNFLLPTFFERKFTKWVAKVFSVYDIILQLMNNTTFKKNKFFTELANITHQSIPKIIL